MHSPEHWRKMPHVNVFKQGLATASKAFALGPVGQGTAEALQQHHLQERTKPSNLSLHGPTKRVCNIMALLAIYDGFGPLLLNTLGAQAAPEVRGPTSSETQITRIRTNTDSYRKPAMRYALETSTPADSNVVSLGRVYHNP